MCVPTSRIPSASITTVQVPGFSTKGSTKLFWGTLTKVGSALGAKTICLDCSEPRKHPRRTEWDTETEGYNCWCMRNKYSQLNNRTFISWTLCFVLTHSQTHSRCDWWRPTSAVRLIGCYFTTGRVALRVYISEDEASQIDVCLAHINLKLHCRLQEGSRPEEVKKGGWQIWREVGWAEGEEME